MANKFTISEKKFDLVRDATKYPSVFGKVRSRFRYEYIHFYVLDMDNNILQSKIIKDFPIKDGAVMDFDIGTDLRNCGYHEGKYKVAYYFLNEVAGSPDGARYPYYYLKSNNYPKWGTPKSKLLPSGERIFYYLNSDENLEIPLKQVANKYSLVEFSGDRTEVAIDVQNINQWDYLNRLHSITRRKRYPKWQHTNAAGSLVDGNNALKYPAGHWKRDPSDPYILELIPQYDDDPGFEFEVERVEN